MNININTDWEWYENTNVFRLFYHCLLHTNLEDRRILRKRNQGRAIRFFDNKNQCRDRLNRIAGPNST